MLNRMNRTRVWVALTATILLVGAFLAQAPRRRTCHAITFSAQCSLP